MKEINVQDLINMNFRICTLVGIMTAFLMETKAYRPRAEHYKFDWVIDAINAVMYENKPIPPFPERDML